MQKIQKARIIDIKSTQARNLLRGIVNEEKPLKIKKTLDKIYAKCSEQDYKKSFEVIREYEIFKDNPATRDFLKTCPYDINLKTKFTPKEIARKINNNKNKILKIIHFFNNTLNSLESGNKLEALKYCDEAVSNHGLSCFLIRVIAFIRNNEQENHDVLKYIENINARINIENIKYLILAIKELTNTKTDFFNICEKIQNSQYHYLNEIAKNFIDPIPRSIESFEKTLNAYYAFSLIDAYLFAAQKEQSFCLLMVLYNWMMNYITRLMN